MTPRRQTVVGLGLAAVVVGCWLALHVYGVLLHPWSPLGLAAAPLLVLAQSWLSVGLFITAHDAMHGSLAPGRTSVNRAVGRVAVGLYAGFSFDRLLAKHHAHHRWPGTREDPDFHPDDPRAFGRWFLRFFTRYFGWREFAFVTAVLVLYLLLGAEPSNLAVFWGLPAIVSAVQLFTFGTWLPHRHGDDLADEHRARSNAYPRWLSLLTCFHFGGFHHEHHTRPHLPWWRLPEARPGSTGPSAPAPAPA